MFASTLEKDKIYLDSMIYRIENVIKIKSGLMWFNVFITCTFLQDTTKFFENICLKQSISKYT